MKPPCFANWLLKIFGHPDTSEEVQGDLLELYAHWLQTESKRKADWRYSLSALKLLRPMAKSKIANEYPQPHLLSLVMIRNYMIIAFRSLIKSKGYSAINIIGLAVGMACTMLIFLAVRHETSYDQYNATETEFTGLKRKYQGKTLVSRYVHRHGECTTYGPARSRISCSSASVGRQYSPLFQTPINDSKNDSYLRAMNYPFA